MKDKDIQELWRSLNSASASSQGGTLPTTVYEPVVASDDLLLAPTVYQPPQPDAKAETLIKRGRKSAHLGRKAPSASEQSGTGWVETPMEALLRSQGIIARDFYFLHRLRVASPDGNIVLTAERRAAAMTNADEGDPCGPGAEPARPALVDDPHATNTANLLDPNLNTTGGTSDLETTDRHHTERDAVAVGGTGFAGAAAYEAEKHESSSVPTSSGAIGAETTDSGVASSDTTGPVHKSSLLNKLDSRVKQDTTSQAGGAGVIGENTTDKLGHEYDVADAGGMQETRVVVPYEHEKSDHHYGADAAGGAALGGVAYEPEKHHEKSAAEPTTTGSSQYDGMAPLGIKHHEPEQQTSLVGTGTSSNYPDLEPTGHKFHDPEQPTSLVGTGGTSEYGVMAPKDQAKERHEEKHKSRGGILGKISGKKDMSDTHDEKDAVEAGAAGAGTAGVAEHEEHKHEHNKLHKDPPAGYTSGQGQAGLSTQAVIRKSRSRSFTSFTPFSPYVATSSNRPIHVSRIGRSVSLNLPSIHVNYMQRTL